MSNRAVVTLASSIFERDHLFVFKLVQDLAGNFGSLDKWRSGSKAVAIPVQNHFVKCDLVAGGCRELFDRNGISRANPILLTSRTKSSLQPPATRSHLTKWFCTGMATASPPDLHLSREPEFPARSWTSLKTKR